MICRVLIQINNHSDLTEAERKRVHAGLRRLMLALGTHKES